MDMNEYEKIYSENKELKDAFRQGYRLGEKHAKEQIKYNKILYTLLLEVIGYDGEWLTTVAGYQKYNKKDLIDIILKQRALMQALYKADASEKENLKVKLEKFFWPVMHQDKG